VADKEDTGDDAAPSSATEDDKKATEELFDEDGAFGELIELELPDVLPIFPLDQAILLPGCIIPLNIFEPRYLAMIRWARDNHRMIGMIQNRSDEALYRIGGGGMINDMKETEEGHLLITLVGISRFEIEEELTVTTPYRQAKVTWQPFTTDIQQMEHDAPATSQSRSDIDRARLFAKLEAFLNSKGLAFERENISKAPDDVLINNLATMIPLSPPEKQALLEATSISARADLLIAMLEMAMSEPAETGTPANLN